MYDPTIIWKPSIFGFTPMQIWLNNFMGDGLLSFYILRIKSGRALLSLYRGFYGRKTIQIFWKWHFSFGERIEDEHHKCPNCGVLTTRPSVQRIGRLDEDQDYCL